MSAVNVSVKSAGGSLSWGNWTDDFNGGVAVGLIGGNVPYAVLGGYMPGASGMGGLHHDLTWEQLGVPVGATVTGITGCSMDSECTEYQPGNGTANNVYAYLSCSGNLVYLSGTRSLTAIDSGFVTVSGSGNPSLSFPSNSLVEMHIVANLQLGTSKRDAIAVEMDNLLFTIQYTP